MRGVESSVAIALLAEDRYKFFAELVSLAAENPYVPKEVYADTIPATVVMVVEHFPHGDSVTFSSYSGAFLREAVTQVLCRLDGFLLISPDRRVFEAAETPSTLEMGKVSCRRSFVCTDLSRVPATQIAAAALTESDEGTFVRYAHKHLEGTPGPADLFRWFVREGRGEILALTEQRDLLGYLSCSPEYRDIWDVEYVHVREDMRGRGLGTVLAATYARQRLTRGQVPYWSSAASEASERTALKAGFFCCREALSAGVRVSR